MTSLRDTFSELVQKWAAFLAAEESRWRHDLRSEGASGPDIEDPTPKSEGAGCGVKPEAPSILAEAAKRAGNVRHDDRR